MGGDSSTHNDCRENRNGKRELHAPLANAFWTVPQSKEHEP